MPYFILVPILPGHYPTANAAASIPLGFVRRGATTMDKMLWWSAWRRLVVRLDWG